jgi:hypothetical protein
VGSGCGLVKKCFFFRSHIASSEKSQNVHEGRLGKGVRGGKRGLFLSAIPGDTWGKFTKNLEQDSRPVSEIRTGDLRNMNQEC